MTKWQFLILKTVKKDPCLRLQMRAKEDFNRRQSLEHFFGKDEILVPL